MELKTLEKTINIYLTQIHLTKKREKIKKRSDTVHIR